MPRIDEADRERKPPKPDIRSTGSEKTAEGRPVTFRFLLTISVLQELEGYCGHDGNQRALAVTVG